MKLLNESAQSSPSMRTRLLRVLYWVESYTMIIAGANMFVGAMLGFVGPLALEGVNANFALY